MTDVETGFDFPCGYAIKALGMAEQDFAELVVEVVTRHCQKVRKAEISLRPSRNGKYVSVTVPIEADSLTQLDAIYAELTAHDKVIMRL